MLKDLKVVDFINELGSDSPAPGGGSVAALTASTAAALIEMVSNLTIDKKGYEDVQDRIKKIQKEASDYKAKFLDYIDKDAASFNAIMYGFRLPKDSEKEKEERKNYLQNAFKQAAEVPYKIGEDAFKLFDLAAEVVKYGNKNTVTDGLVAAINARAAVKSAFYNVKINLSSIKDEEFNTQLIKKMQEIEDKLDDLESKILAMASL